MAFQYYVHNQAAVDVIIYVLPTMYVKKKCTLMREMLKTKI